MTALVPGELAPGELAPGELAPGELAPPGPPASRPSGPDWLWEALGLRIEVRQDGEQEPPQEHHGEKLRELVGLALRRNPRRAHLLVSRVLGKHLPVPPAVALDAGARLADLVRALPEAGRRPGPVPTTAPAPVVIGYCETATALGHAVADGLPNSHYLHTTRRAVPGTTPLLEFVESHSHATHHWLMPEDPDVLAASGRLVLVDDELSTGRTALGTIRILHAFAPRTDYAVAALVDARPPAARAAFAALAAELGVRLDVVSLVAATVSVPEDVTERASAIRGSYAALAPAPDPVAAGGPSPEGAVVAVPPAAAVTRVAVSWPAGLPDGARHGWSPAVRERLTEALPAAARDVLAALRSAHGDGAARGGDILVLGTEELMYVPMRLAHGLAELTERHVVYQSTTRSPVHPLDVDGYAIRSSLTFPAPDDPGRVSHVYNVGPGRYDDIVVVVDSGMDGRGPVPGGPALDGLLAELAACAPVTVVTLPCYVPERAA
ncbi:phosphoribosyl transferase [Parafrankia colletiae]|uniref:Phosphoribosyl transferase n=1 Tax=Parafrankia colletiae TaxID=573497 RepID=A0A1S1Q7I6_9ACTN|nr:phosphoribosyltransferase family protein [Parafrankia colletiae]MCK9902949.1 phosphoribosyltransferase family protein [Frankia sp. Cpl3]OHV29910.1 phosphoribosyl transferase [Parafrankia colletiae]